MGLRRLTTSPITPPTTTKGLRDSRVVATPRTVLLEGALSPVGLNFLALLLLRFLPQLFVKDLVGFDDHPGGLHGLCPIEDQTKALVWSPMLAARGSR